MPNKLTDLVESTTTKKLQYRKALSTTNIWHPDTQHVERSNQQQQQRHYRSSSTQFKSKSKRTIPVTLEKCSLLTSNYHPWKWNYLKIIIREKYIKPMTKDSYMSLAHIIPYTVVESIVTENECYSSLIPANSVNIEIFNIRRAPKSIIVRYIRRHGLMPSERSKLI